MISEKERYPDQRAYPVRPIVGIAGVVISRGNVLLVRRGKEPMRGRWTFPGGVLELGESVESGVFREVCEETGIKVLPRELVEVLDAIHRDESGIVQYHYVLLDWLCIPLETRTVLLPEPVAGTDAEAAVWAPLDALDPLALDDRTKSIILRAAARVGELCLG